MAEKKRRLVVFACRDISYFLRASGIYPDALYTDLAMLVKDSMFFEDVIVMFILQSCASISRMVILQNVMKFNERAEDDSDFAIHDVILLSDVYMPTCDDYFYYEDNPASVIRYRRLKPMSKEQKLIKLLDYEEARQTRLYLTDSDYGFNSDALHDVREKHANVDAISAQIKIPTPYWT